MPAIPSTSGRLHSEFVRLLFLQTYRETDRFFAVSGVQLEKHDRDQFHFRRAAFSVQLKRRVGLNLAKAAALRINLNIDGDLVSIFRYSSSPINPVYARSVNSSALVFSLSSHRHSYIGLVFSSRFIDSNKQLVDHTLTHPLHTQTSRLLTSSLSLGVPVPHVTLCM
jgi:hypothetical protein